MSIQYMEGDATIPHTRPVIIAHICNNLGLWGAGFVVALGKRYPKAKAEYLDWHRQRGSLSLTDIQLVQVEKQVWVANMIAQNGVWTCKNPRPLCYESLELCLMRLRMIAFEHNAAIQMPKIGTGLGRGDWKIIQGLIQKCLANNDTDVFVLELPK